MGRFITIVQGFIFTMVLGILFTKWVGIQFTIFRTNPFMRNGRGNRSNIRNNATGPDESG